MLRHKVFTTLASINHRHFHASTVFSNEKQNVASSKELSEKRKQMIEDDKEKLVWRAKIQDQPYAFKSKFRVFDNEDLEPNSLSMMVQPIDFSPKGIKNWFNNYKVRKEKYLQQFIPERHEVLGNDLAAAHFLLYRQAKVKFVGHDDWMELNDENSSNIPLPNRFNPHYELEAIKCDGMVLYYEGLENLRRLKKLVYLSFKDVKTFDDWCMDRVSGAEYDRLEVLDISGTSVTANGLQALYRMSTLKKLIVTHLDDPRWNLTLAMLSDIFPDLEIISSGN